jgi:hypothetical protein
VSIEQAGATARPLKVFATEGARILSEIFWERASSEENRAIR